jgi:hypothetical protein
MPRVGLPNNFFMVNFVSGSRPVDSFLNLINGACKGEVG